MSAREVLQRLRREIAIDSDPLWALSWQQAVDRGSPKKKPGQQGFQPIIPLIWLEVSISRAELLQMARKRRTGNIQLLANLTDD
jgi:hypothetical protein